MLSYFPVAVKHDYEGKTVSARGVHCNVTLSPFLVPECLGGDTSRFLQICCFC